MSHPIQRRLLGWGLGLGGGCLVSAGGIGALLFLVAAAFFTVFGGLGYHAQQTPPPLPTQAVFSGQWLNLVQHVATANGFFTQYPAVLWIADIQAASGGMPLDRTPAGGYGLYDMPQPTAMGHPLAATNAFALDLRTHQVFQNLQATLNGVGTTLAPARADWSATVRNALNALEQGPAIAAWPVSLNWTAGQWQYPATTRMNLVATATAPVGSAYTLVWTPPVEVCPPRGSCYWVTDDLTGRDVEGPLTLSVTTAAGRVVPMQPVEGPSTADGFVYPHAVLWVTTTPVRVNAHHPVTLTARWGPGVTASVQLPGTGFGVTPSGPAGVPIAPGNPETVAQIWARYGADIRAGDPTGVPVSLLVSEAYEESRGVNWPYVNNQVPCGVWQMFSPGSFTAYAPPGATVAACANPAVEAPAAAGYLAVLHDLFGSWRIALAAYYGGPGNVTRAGVAMGVPWPVAAARLNWVPDPANHNTETMTTYADASYATAVAFAQAHGLPMP